MPWAPLLGVYNALIAAPQLILLPTASQAVSECVAKANGTKTNNSSAGVAAKRASTMLPRLRSLATTDCP
jgi:hypothetical protein